MKFTPLTTRIIWVAVALVVTLLAPFLLRPKSASDRSEADEVLVIISPHNEAIRNEFAEAFKSHISDTRGINLYIDWRTPGGTSEIRRMIDSEFAHADEQNNKGIGIDLFFGGGPYDFTRQAANGHFAPSSAIKNNIETFLDGTIPYQFSGETYYDANGLWVGTCLASFGIVYNTDSLEALGIESPPRTWDDLADPRYFGKIALADPTKSGSANKTFEAIIQQKIQLELAAIPAYSVHKERSRNEAIKRGWTNALNLIQRICANARYFTDSASKIPLDVAQGNAAAGMCIDFYGRTLSERMTKADGSSRVQFISPQGGTSVSVDPVAIFKGAPNPQMAEAFVEFLVSKEGQRLWNFKVNSPGGPEHTALRRLPVRRDLYTDDELVHFSDPDALPYETGAGFTYDASLTGNAFSAIAVIIKAMCIDSHQELAAAMTSVNANGNPPQAEGALFDISLASYGNATGGIRDALASDDRIQAAKLNRNLVQRFRENYRRATALAHRSTQ